jgi:LDH2 family malate/lactate/ureidoglycolate dehydrogenase
LILAASWQPRPRRLLLDLATSTVAEGNVLEASQNEIIGQKSARLTVLS